MYFDLSYIRSFLSTAIKVLFILGAALMAIGGVLSLVELPDFTDGSQLERLLTGLKYVSFQIFNGGFILIVCSLIGFLSTKVNNDITVGLFACSTVLVFLSFLVFSLGFAGLVIAIQSQSIDQKVCLNSPLFSTPQLFFTKSSRYFGSKYCKVKLDHPEIFSNNQEFQNAQLTIDQDNGYTSVMNCPHYNDLLADLNISSMNNMGNYLGSLEAAFQCSGVCSGYPIYIFSDVNKGQPSQSNGCFLVISQYISAYGWPILIVIWGITCLMMLLTLNSLCLFAHPRRYDDLYLYQPITDNETGDSLENNKLNESCDSIKKGESGQFQLTLSNARNHIQRRSTHEIDSQQEQLNDTQETEGLCGQEEQIGMKENLEKINHAD